MSNTRCLLLVLTIALVPRAAFAQHTTSVHGLGDVTIGYSDNLLAAPSDPEPGQPGPEAAYFTRIASGLAFVHETRRAQHVFTLMHATQFAFGLESEHAASDTVRWESFFALSPRDELTLTASVEQAATRIAVLSQPAEQGRAAPQTYTDDLLMLYALSERYAYELTPRWRVNQSASMEAATPRRTQGEQPTRLQPRLGAGASYSVERNAFGLQGEVGYFWQSAYGQGDARQPSSAEILTEVRAEWTHDLDPVWSTHAAIGAAHATVADDTSTMIGAAIWRGAIRFDDHGYAAELAGQRAMVPNLLVSQVLLTDQASLAGGVPMVESWSLYAASTFAYAHHRTLDVEGGGFANEFDTAIFDTALTWRPEGLPWVAARYQHQRQLGDEAGEVPISRFERNTVSISAGYMFPPRTLPRVPVVPPRRVDGGDRDPSAPTDDAALRMARRRR